MFSLNVKGQASGKSWKFSVSDSDMALTVMHFLLQHNLPIASSCGGEGICKKCVINNDIVSCQITLKTYFRDFPSHHTLHISYL
jgi:hypothetical protein